MDYVNKCSNEDNRRLFRYKYYITFQQKWLKSKLPLKNQGKVLSRGSYAHHRPAGTAWQQFFKCGRYHAAFSQRWYSPEASIEAKHGYAKSSILFKRVSELFDPGSHPLISIAQSSINYILMSCCVYTSSCTKLQKWVNKRVTDWSIYMLYDMQQTEMFSFTKRNAEKDVWGNE